MLISSTTTLFAIDVVTLRDDTQFLGEVFAYSTLGNITMQEENGASLSLPSHEVLLKY